MLGLNLEVEIDNRSWKSCARQHVVDVAHDCYGKSDCAKLFRQKVLDFSAEHLLGALRHHAVHSRHIRDSSRSTRHTAHCSEAWKHSLKSFKRYLSVGAGVLQPDWDLDISCVHSGQGCTKHLH